MAFIIPAIDISEGKVVRLTRGEFNQKTVYSENPFEIVRFFKHRGIKRIHIVDLDGAKSGELVNFETVKRMKQEFNDIVFQFGGGIRNIQNVNIVLDSGIDFVVIGSMFFKKPEEFLKAISTHRDRVILSLDINVDKIVIHGWQNNVDIPVEEAFDKAIKIGVRRIMSTDVSRDGTLLGPDTRFISNLLSIIRKKYFDTIIQKILSRDEVKPIVDKVIETIKKNIDEFYSVLKDTHKGEYELRKTIESYDREIESLKEDIKITLLKILSDIVKEYPKPLLIISGGISSDSDIKDIQDLDNGFLEGIIIGKAIYERRISIFS